jgi:hypothetical protein
MESRAKLFGHAIHPILIVYPLGLLSTAVIFDVIHLVTANPRWATISFWMIAAGIVGGLLAAIFGLIDPQYSIRDQSEAYRSSARTRERRSDDALCDQWVPAQRSSGGTDDHSARVLFYRCCGGSARRMVGW